MQMKVQIIILVLLLCLSPCFPKCTDSLECFRKKLFNFEAPGEGIYQLKGITTDNMTSKTNMLSYADFNNDLQYLFSYSALIT
jgi:hypothetical protein